MKSKLLSLDVVCYICGVRAIGNSAAWDQVLTVLEQAYDDIGEEVIQVVHAAMTNLKYAVSAHDDALDPLAKVDQLMQWLETRAISPTVQTLDISLAVACGHGSASDIELALKRYGALGVNPSEYTFNTLLGK